MSRKRITQIFAVMMVLVVYAIPHSKALAGHVIDPAGITYVYDAGAPSPVDHTDSTGAELCDGLFAPAFGGFDAAYVGYQDLDTDDGTPQPQVTFNLGEVVSLESLNIFYGVYDAAGIHAPDSMIVSFSTDGINFGTGTSFTDFDDSACNPVVLRQFAADMGDLEASHVRVSFANDAEWTFLSEVQFVETTVPDQNGAFDVPEVGAVTIDGDLSDWSDSTEWSEDFILWNDNGAPLTSTTKAKFAWSDAGDMLYVAIQTDQANGGHAVVGVGTTIDDVPTSGEGATQLAFDVQPDGSVSVMNEIQYYSDKYSAGWPGGGTDDVVAAQTNDGTTWTYELAIPYWKDWATMDERQTISADDEYYIYLVMEDALEGGNGTDMTYEGNPRFYEGHFEAASKLTFKETKIPGDANCDGKVDGSDVTILAGNWQAGVNPGDDAATWDMGDFNGDGKVDGSDVTILAGNWQAGVTTATASVPEPGTFSILLGAIVVLFTGLRVRRNH